MNAQRQPLARLGVNLRFTVRYNRVRLVVWLVMTVGMIGFIGAYYASLDPKALQDLIAAGATDSMKSLLGWLSAAVPGQAPLGAAVWIKGWMFVGLMACIGMVFLVTHNLRADEDAGRTEVFRSRPLGLHSSLMATLIMAVVLVVVIGVGTGLTGVGLRFGALLGSELTSDPNPMGSWVFGASIAGLGLLGIGLGVLANEIMPSSGAANGLASAIIGVFYLIRMGADVGNEDLAWLSPIGWAEKMDPWGEDRLWPAALLLLLAAVLVGVGWVIEARRDYAGSVFPARLGPANARPSMTSVVGLAIRLQRTAWVSWAIGIVVFGLMLGGITPMMADMFESVDIAGVDVSSGMLAVVGFLMAMVSLAVAAFSIYSASTLALDDAHGLLEQQLAGSVSRLGWAGKRLGVTFVGTVALLVIFGATFAASYCAGMEDFSDFGKIVATVLAYIPSMTILMGVVVLGFGWWPRQAIAVGWGFFGALWFIMILGEALRLPDAVLQSLPFVSAASIPAEAPDWPVLIITLAVGLALIAAGLVGFRRRDVPA